MFKFFFEKIIVNITGKSDLCLKIINNLIIMGINDNLDETIGVNDCNQVTLMTCVQWQHCVV